MLAQVVVVLLHTNLNAILQVLGVRHNLPTHMMNGYTQPATFYYPRAQVTVGSLVSEGSAEVHTDSQVPQGTLGAVCSVSPRPAFVGQEVTLDRNSQSSWFRSVYLHLDFTPK